jgi:cyclin-dependent kinase 12/13
MIYSFFLCGFSQRTEQGGEIPKNVFMVFEYLEYDLTGILDSPEIRFTQDHVKSWSQQLLSGVHYMHTNKGIDDALARCMTVPTASLFAHRYIRLSFYLVIHRDLKASNLLINRKGELKIADWGLARSWNAEMKRLTNRVITLWYRPPELLLGYVDYTPKIDMWSTGCIIAEMFRRKALFQEHEEPRMLDLIFRTCGTPTAENWPDLPKRSSNWKNVEPAHSYPRRIREILKANLPNPKWMTDNAVDIIDKLLILDPEKRWSAEQALDADYFFENPIVKPAEKLPMNFSVTSKHEWDCKKKYEQMQARMRQAQASNGGTLRPPPPPKTTSSVAKPPPPPPRK